MIRKFLNWLMGDDLRCKDCGEIEPAHRVGCPHAPQPDEPAPEDPEIRRWKSILSGNCDTVPNNHFLPAVNLDEDNVDDDSEEDDPDTVWLEYELPDEDSAA